MPLCKSSMASNLNFEHLLEPSLGASTCRLTIRCSGLAKASHVLLTQNLRLFRKPLNSGVRRHGSALSGTSMKQSDWIQLLSSLAIIAGIILVIVELRQAEQLARAQLTSDYVETMNGVHGSVLGEDLASALSKACLNPEELTLEETYILDSYYFTQANLVSRMILLTERDGLYEEDYWTGQLSHLRTAFSSSYGRAWFKQIDQDGWPPLFFEEANKFMDRLGPNHCQNSYRAKLEAIAN